MTAPPLRAIRDALPAGLVGVVAPYLVAAGWGWLASAVWGPALRVAVFVDPAAPRPAGYAAGSRLFTLAVGAPIGAALGRAPTRGAAAPWGRWVAFAAGVALSAALVDAAALRQPVLLLLIAASALGFRLGAWR